MENAVKIVECPRDAWQGLPVHIPSEEKARYLLSLIDAGFKHIDAVSFVSAAAVPQMADSESVLQLLDPPGQVEIIGIVVNRRGADRAIRTRAVRTLGFPFSISVEFLNRNQHQTPQESLHELKAVSEAACAAGLRMVAYLSMAFGNPYEEPWSIDAVVEACDRIGLLGINQISLADTVGRAHPEQISEVVAAVRAAIPDVEFGVHLHAPPDEAPKRIRAAFNAGCMRFDSAVGGLGGCPLAQDSLVGNIPTEVLLAELARCGATLPRLGSLEPLIRKAEDFAVRATFGQNRSELRDVQADWRIS